jgi:hypothetical protein
MRSIKINCYISHDQGGNIIGGRLCGITAVQYVHCSRRSHGEALNMTVTSVLQQLRH